MLTLNTRILSVFFFAIFSAVLFQNSLLAQDNDDDEIEYDVKLYNMITKSPKSFTTWKSANPDAPINLEGADLSGVNFTGLNLSGAIFKNASLTGANFSNANLKGANFANADLGEEDNMSVNFENANLTDVNFQGADITQAYFIKSVLVNVNFKEAELVGATFKNADVSGANFKGADINGIVFDGTIFSENTTFTGAEGEGIQVKGGCKFKQTGSTEVKTVSSYNEIKNLTK